MSIEEARELLGNDFLGPEQVEQAFGVKLAVKEIPVLPYSREDLETAKEQGEMLVLRIEHDDKGELITMEHLTRMFASQMPKNIKFLYAQEKAGNPKLGNDCWYKNEHFFKQHSPKLEWKLVSKNVLPNSTSKDYIEQTRILREHLHNSLTPQELAECSDAKLEELRELMKTDWKKAAQQLSELLINQNHRRRPVEVLYDLALRFGAQDERLLQDKRDWTCACSSDGNLVSTGDFDAKGARVNGWLPDSSNGDLGVVSSR